MFGESTHPDPKLEAWANDFLRSEPTSLRGALVYQNLQDDANVCPDFRSRFYDYVLGAQGVTSPAEAGTLYQAFLQDLNSEMPACLRPENRENQIAAPSLTGLAHVVDGDAFIKYNLFAGNKRRVPRRYRSARSIQTKTRLKEIQKKGIEVPQLRGTIGPTVVFATGDDLVERVHSGKLDAQGVRNRLGLDDRTRFGRDRFMVVYRYRADRPVDGRFYRPTVLDAGWGEASGAFLPSPPSPAQPGRTQDLNSGTPAELELVHSSFPANQVSACEVLGALDDDPPNDYRSVRLRGRNARSP